MFQFLWLQKMKASIGAVLLFFSSWAAWGADVTDGLVLDYRFEKIQQGKVFDSSASDLPGILLGNQVPPQPANSLGGHGQSLEFEGSEKQFLYVADAAPLDVNKFTLSAWIFLVPKVHDARWEVLEKAGAYWMNIRTDTRQIRVGAFFNGCEGDPGVLWKFADSDSAVAPRMWTHVAGTYDGANIRIYIDGVLDKTYAVTGTVCSNNEVLAVGAKFNPGKDIREAFWDGRIDDLRIYKRALSGPEINSIKNVTFPAP